MLFSSFNLKNANEDWLDTAWLSMRLTLAFSDIQLFAGPAHLAPYYCMHKDLEFEFE